ncbi:MAG: esterase family protein [Porphyromonadaceae bacterium]|nr:esterase family protein [Porphyromonadaceae bacterium]
MKKSLLIISTFLFSFSSFISAAKVDTVVTFSPSMNKNIKAVVIIPDTYEKANSFPVFYLLHGFSGNYGSWVNDMPATKSLADTHQMIIVCPDGGFSSWYFDSPTDSTYKYETYVTKELIQWIDKNFKTIPKREARAISGLSMGGHGGLYLGFRNQEIFGACGSMSGGVDIRPFPNNWDLRKRLGTQSQHPENWEKHTVMNLLHRLTPKSQKIIIDCGTEDFFYNVNLRLHKELKYRNIPHDFISRPGGHNGEYWNNAVKYQALYFSEYFQNMGNKK